MERMKSKRHRRIGISALIIIVLIGAGVFLSTKKAFDLHENPKTACDCKKALRYYVISGPTARDQTLPYLPCFYRYILNSGNYHDCGYFGTDCVQYLEKNGIDCTEDLCGAPSEDMTDDRIQRLAEIRKQLEDPDIQSGNITLLNRLIEEQNNLTDEMVNIDVDSHSDMGVMSYLSDNGC